VQLSRRIWPMKKLLLALLFIPAIVQAESLPNGCYVAFSNPGFCYEPTVGLSWLSTTNQSSISPFYGVTMAIVISRNAENKASAESCSVDYSALSSAYTLLSNECSALKTNCDATVATANGQYNSLNAQYNSLVGGYNSLLAQNAKLKKQIKALKKHR